MHILHPPLPQTSTPPYYFLPRKSAMPAIRSYIVCSQTPSRCCMRSPCDIMYGPVSIHTRPCCLTIVLLPQGRRGARLPLQRRGGRISGQQVARRRARRP